MSSRNPSTDLGDGIGKAKSSFTYDPDTRVGHARTPSKGPSNRTMYWVFFGVLVFAFAAASGFSWLEGRTDPFFPVLWVALVFGVVVAFGARPRGSWMFNEDLPKIIPGLIDLLPDEPVHVEFRIHDGLLELTGRDAEDQVVRLDGSDIRRFDDRLMVTDTLGNQLELRVEPEAVDDLARFEAYLKRYARSVGSASDVPERLRQQRAKVHSKPESR